MAANARRETAKNAPNKPLPTIRILPPAFSIVVFTLASIGPPMWVNDQITPIDMANTHATKSRAARRRGDCCGAGLVVGGIGGRRDDSTGILASPGPLRRKTGISRPSSLSSFPVCFAAGISPESLVTLRTRNSSSAFASCFRSWLMRARFWNIFTAPADANTPAPVRATVIHTTDNEARSNVETNYHEPDRPSTGDYLTTLVGGLC